MNEIEKLIKSGNATIIDVRSPADFMSGHAKGSINIPFNELPDKIKEIKEMKNVLLCCTSGNKSGQAAVFLKQQGVVCENAGSWMLINELLI